MAAELGEWAIESSEIGLNPNPMAQQLESPGDMLAFIGPLAIYLLLLW